MKRKHKSVFDDDGMKIWRWVYGIPCAIGLVLLLLVPNPAAKYLGALLIAGVFGSWFIISTIEMLDP